MFVPFPITDVNNIWHCSEERLYCYLYCCGSGGLF